MLKGNYKDQGYYKFDRVASGACQVGPTCPALPHTRYLTLLTWLDLCQLQSILPDTRCVLTSNPSSAKETYNIIWEASTPVRWWLSYRNNNQKSCYMYPLLRQQSEKYTCRLHNKIQISWFHHKFSICQNLIYNILSKHDTKLNLSSLTPKKSNA